MTDDEKTLLNDMKFEYIPIDQIKPNPKNPRIPLVEGIPQYHKLRNSIEHFGFMEPIIWNKRSGMIVSGHQRFQVLQDVAESKGIKLTKVPAMVIDKDENDEKTFLLSANKIVGLWDMQKVADIFGEIPEEYREFTGFDKTEIDALFNIDDMNDITIEDEQQPTFEKPRKKVTCPDCGKVFEI